MPQPNLRAVAILMAGLLAGCAAAPDASAPSDLAARVDPALRMAAISAEASHDYKGAAQHWRTLLAHHPDDQGIAVSLARALRFSGDGQEAADLMQATAARLGHNSDLMAEMGKDYLAADRMGLARRSLAEAGRLDPRRWDVPDALAICDDIEGKPQAAAAHYAAALKLSPDNPQVLNNLALSQALAGRLDAAIATLRRADDQPTAGPEVRQNMAFLLALRGDSTQAERIATHELPTGAQRANADIYRAIARAVRP